MKLLYPIIFLLTSCTLFNSKTTGRIASKDNNVAKKLSGNVLLYGIFVDSEATTPFSRFDIETTQDSIRKAMSWIEKQAKKANMPLTIQTEFYTNKNKLPVKHKFKRKTFSATLYTPNTRVGIKNVDSWADKIAKTIQPSLGAGSPDLITTQNKPSDRERLIARLRDKYNVENVALIYFINNYYENETSVAFHTSFSEVEYAVVSYKRTGVIAHEFLHLFGAWDLYYDPIKGRRANRKLKKIRDKYPKMIMSGATSLSIDQLQISPITKYLVGWANTLNKEDAQQLFGKKVKLSSY